MWWSPGAWATSTRRDLYAGNSLPVCATGAAPTQHVLRYLTSVTSHVQPFGFESRATIPFLKSIQHSPCGDSEIGSRSRTGVQCRAKIKRVSVVGTASTSELVHSCIPGVPILLAINSDAISFSPSKCDKVCSPGSVIGIARLPGNVAPDQNKAYGKLEFTSCDAQRHWAIRKIDWRFRSRK